MNVKLLRKVKDEICKKPSQFNMDWFYNDRDQLGNKPSNCGTALCIAGWGICLSQKINPNDLMFQDGDFFARARKIFDLTQGQAENLFDANNWDWRFDYEFEGAGTMKKKTKIAAEYIDYFIDKYGKNEN